MIDLTHIQYIRVIEENKKEQCLQVHGAILFTYHNETYSSRVSFLLFENDGEGLDLRPGKKLQTLCENEEELTKIMSDIHEAIYFSKEHDDIYEELFKKHQQRYGTMHLHDPRLEK